MEVEENMIQRGIIGTMIKKFRKEKQMTQEELGKKIGVTTQAVSKWECGGTPDAEILPDIAEALEVSVDALFGRTDEVKKDVKQFIAYELQNTPEEERLHKAYEMMWASLVASSGLESMNELLSHMSNVKKDTKGAHLFRLLTKQGFAVGNLTEDNQYMLVGNKPTSGYEEELGSVEAYKNFFEFLAKEETLQILFFFMTRKPASPITTSVIARHIKSKKEDCQLLLDKLCEFNLLVSKEVEIEEGVVMAYAETKQLFLLGMLMIAKNAFSQDSIMLDLSTLSEKDVPTIL